jgi:mannonate dehydratase
MKHPLRSVIVTFIACSAIGLAGCDTLIKKVGGDYTGPPKSVHDFPSDSVERRLIDEAFTGLEEYGVIDYHLHTVGLGSGLGQFQQHCPDVTVTTEPVTLNDRRFGYQDMEWSVKRNVLQSALTICDLNKANETYASRMTDIANNLRWHESDPPGRLHLLAMDGYYDHVPKDQCTASVDGRNHAMTDIFVPNQFVIDLAACVNGQFKDHNPIVPVVSVHPERFVCDPSAVGKQLEEYRRKGVLYVKLLPNSQNIDPANPLYLPYFEKIRDLGMVILTHTGFEDAIISEDQDYGNPLRWEHALSKTGVTVIMAHGGYKGMVCDGDQELTTTQAFLKLLRKPEYACSLFGDLSASVFFEGPNYGRIDGECSKPATTTERGGMRDSLVAFMEDEMLRHRMINGSDYPLPGVSLLNPTTYLRGYGFITPEEKQALDAIYGINPVLFDFVVKRTLKHPDDMKNHHHGNLPHPRKLPNEMFMTLQDQLAAGGCSPLPEPIYTLTSD